jgi:hypothetical protein
MVAVDPENRNKMITIIADILDMSSEISPLLAPLIIRDEKVENAEKAIEAGDFQKAAELFEEVSDLCLTLGDDTVSQDFHQKALKIRKILKSMTPKKEKVKIQKEPEQKPTDEKMITPGPPPTPPQEKAQTNKPPLTPPGPPPAPLQSENKIESPQAPSIKKPSVKPPTIKVPSKVEPQTDIDNQPEKSPTKPIKSRERQLRELNSQIMDLKIKITNTKKILMDLEMENIMGTLSDEDFKKKSERLEAIEKKIQTQIEDLEKLR